MNVFGVVQSNITHEHMVLVQILKLSVTMAAAAVCEYKATLDHSFKFESVDPYKNNPMIK